MGAAAAALARDLQVGFLGLWLGGEARSGPRGIRGRRGDAPDATVEIFFQRQLAFPTGPIAWHRIDVGGPPSEALAALSKMIG